MTNNDERRCGVAVTRVLLVEDDDGIARSLERMIRAYAAGQVDVRRTGTAEVAELLLADPVVAGGVFDVVISDFNLGGARNGGDVLARVRSLPVQPAFMFLSSDERCAGRGVEWLQKPCAGGELREAVMRLLDPPKTVIEMPLEGCA